MGAFYLLNGGQPNASKQSLAGAYVNTLHKSWADAAALSQADRKEETIKMYRISLALNPQNEQGKKALAELLR